MYDKKNIQFHKSLSYIILPYDLLFYIVIFYRVFLLQREWREERNYSSHNITAYSHTKIPISIGVCTHLSMRCETKNSPQTVDERTIKKKEIDSLK